MDNLTAAALRLRARVGQHAVALSVGFGCLVCIAWIQCLPRIGTQSLRAPLADDAYYVLTVARNLARGLGLSYAGEPTNGFQPLFLLLVYFVGTAAGWDSQLSPALLARVVSALYFVLSTFALARLLRRVLPEEHGWMVLATSMVWCFGPTVAAASEGLEAPLVLAFWCFTLSATIAYDARPTSQNALIFGSITGLAFLMRNDTVVLTLVCGSFLARRHQAAGKVRWRHLTLAGAVFVPFVLPWLVYNVWLTGNPVPQSGAAEAIGGLYDEGRLRQAGKVLTVVGRYLAILPFPMDRMEPYLGAVCGGTIVVATAFAHRLLPKTEPGPMRVALRLCLVAATLLSVIYALAFGAPHMVLRWLAPWWIAALLLGLRLALFWVQRGSGHGPSLIVIVVLVIAASLYRVSLIPARWRHP